MKNTIKNITTCFFISLIITGCQSTTRFVTQDKAIKTSNTIANNKTENTSKKIVDTQHYNVPAKTIYPKELSNKYSSNIISIAEKWLGTPYLYGGNTKAGVDCSGFVKNVYKELGIDLPRTSAQQFATLKHTNSPVVGDLVFFKKGNVINHVGIFIGDGKMIHSASKRGVVIETILGTSLEHRLAGYRKVF